MATTAAIVVIVILLPMLDSWEVSSTAPHYWYLNLQLHPSPHLSHYHYLTFPGSGDTLLRTVGTWGGRHTHSPSVIESAVSSNLINIWFHASWQFYFCVNIIPSVDSNRQDLWVSWYYSQTGIELLIRSCWWLSKYHQYHYPRGSSSSACQSDLSSFSCEWGLTSGAYSYFLYFINNSILLLFSFFEV